MQDKQDFLSYQSISGEGQDTTARVSWPSPPYILDQRDNMFEYV